MSGSRLIGVVAVLLVTLFPLAASAAERLRCLSRSDQRAAISESRAVPLAVALRALPNRGRGELVRARLCQDGNHLVYHLMVLPRDGKVRRMVVDASTGNVVSER